MDPEKQPLLSPVGPKVKRREFRVLTSEEVLHIRQEVTWRRARFFLVILFWSLIAMTLSIITCLLVSAPRCNAVDMAMDRAPSIPPVHLSFAPLMSIGRAAKGE